MTTVNIKISDPVIRRNIQAGVRQLRDPRFPLYVRPQKCGERASWYLVQHKGGKSTWHRLGTWPELSAKVLMPQIPDRLADLSAQAEVVADHWGFTSQVLVWYRDRQLASAGLSIHRKATIKSVVNRHLIARIGGLRLEDIDKAQLDEKLIQPLQAVLSLSYVRQCFVVLKAAFRRARRLGLIGANPVADFSLSDFLDNKIKPKPSRLKGPHIAPLLATLQAAPVPRQLLGLLQLMHGTRITETRLMRWGWIDWDAGRFELPGEVTKNGNPLVLPLTDQSRALLQGYRRWQQKRGYSGGLLFPGSVRRQPISDSTAQQWYRALSGRAWSSHDLRKLARTSWADLGIDHHVGEEMVNHAGGVLSATYIQTALQEQKLRALSAWHRLLVDRGLEIQIF